jgi:hypothetical protein
MSLFDYKRVPRYRNKVAKTPTADAAGWKVTSAAAGTRHGEILVAIKGLDTKNAVATPTFTPVQPATTHFVTGQVFTYSVTASSAVTVSGTPTVALTIGGLTRQALYNKVTSTNILLKFDYTFVAGDVAPSTSIVIAGAIVPEKGYGITMPINANASAKLPDSSLTYTALANSTTTVN